MPRTFVVLALLVLSACDSSGPVVPRTTDQQQVEISSYELYGVETIVESDGRTEFILSNEITNVFRFGALPSLRVAEPCAENVDVCASVILNRPTEVEVTLSRAVVVEGETLEAGTDLSEFLSAPDRDYLLDVPPSVPDVPDPDDHVTIDPGVIDIPDGEVRVTVRWTTNSPSVSYNASTLVTFTR